MAAVHSERETGNRSMRFWWQQDIRFLFCSSRINYGFFRTNVNICGKSEG